MKFAIQSRRDTQSNELMELAKTYLQDFGLQVDEEEPEIVLPIGGDGTLCMRFTAIPIGWTRLHLSASIQGTWVFMQIGNLQN